MVYDMNVWLIMLIIFVSIFLIAFIPLLLLSGYKKYKTEKQHKIDSRNLHRKYQDAWKWFFVNKYMECDDIEKLSLYSDISNTESNLIAFEIPCTKIIHLLGIAAKDSYHWVAAKEIYNRQTELIKTIDTLHFLSLTSWVSSDMHMYTEGSMRHMQLFIDFQQDFQTNYEVELLKLKYEV